MSSREDHSGLFAALIGGYGDLTRRLTRRLGTRADAQEVLQDTGVRLARAHDLPEIANPAAYVRQIAGNLAIDRLRAQQLRDRYFVMGDSHDHDAGVHSAERIVDYRQRLARLRNVIQTLPDRQREAFLLHKFDGLTHAEIALRLGISQSGVEKLIMKALARCRDGMGDLLDAD